MTLYLSTDAGQHYTAAQDVAKIGFGYGDFDNTRVAIDDAGTGFITFIDHGGLEVADLYPLNSEYRRLKVSNGVVALPVTCPAPKKPCSVSYTLTSGSAGKLAGGETNVPPGATATLMVHLAASAAALLKAHHGKLPVTLMLRITPPGTPGYTATEKAVLKG